MLPDGSRLRTCCHYGHPKMVLECSLDILKTCMKKTTFYLEKTEARCGKIVEERKGGERCGAPASGHGVAGASLNS